MINKQRSESENFLNPIQKSHSETNLLVKREKQLSKLEVNHSSHMPKSNLHEDTEIDFHISNTCDEVHFQVKSGQSPPIHRNLSLQKRESNLSSHCSFFHLDKLDAIVPNQPNKLYKDSFFDEPIKYEVVQELLISET